MKLYYFPGACSLAPHILAEEAGLALELVKVDFATGRAEDGGELRVVNPKGYVPALVLDDGLVLTEVMVLLQYLGDRAPQSGLMPAAGSMARYRIQEWLAFIATEVHKLFGPLWNPNAPEASREIVRGFLAKRFAWLDGELAHRPYLMGDGFTAADCYLFVMLAWADYLKLDMVPYGNLAAFRARVGARPAVQKALQAEGLA
jgi:glutathione S-transferase